MSVINFCNFVFFQSIINSPYPAVFIYQCKKLGMDKLVLYQLGAVWFAIVDHVTLPGHFIQFCFIAGNKIPVGVGLAALLFCICNRIDIL